MLEGAKGLLYNANYDLSVQQLHRSDEYQELRRVSHHFNKLLDVDFLQRRKTRNGLD